VLMEDCKNFCLLIFTFTLFCCCDTPIDKYQPQDQDEKEILSVLIQYQNAKNHFEIDQLLSFLHENGKFSFQCGVMVSKVKLKELLPGFWAGIKAGNAAVFPMTHECVNGDYYKSGKLNNLQIEIGNDKAEVTVLFTKGFSRVLQYFSMVRENDRWLITRTEWGHS
jgi:hypothetical protein